MKFRYLIGLIVEQFDSINKWALSTLEYKSKRYISTSFWARQNEGIVHLHAMMMFFSVSKLDMSATLM